MEIECKIPSCSNSALGAKQASGVQKSKIDQLYCINEQLANDVLLVSKIILGYEEALWPKHWR